MSVPVPLFVDSQICYVTLKMIHDFALYHTDLCFDTEEKIALFNLKLLWEGLEKINRGG